MRNRWFWLVMFLRCTDNNAIMIFVRCGKIIWCTKPGKIRQGLENVSVADYMLSNKGSGSMLTGKARTISALRNFAKTCMMGFLFIYHMEDHNILNSLNPSHVAVLHYVFCPEINRKLLFWSDSWARHRLRTVKSTPLILWTSWQLQNPVGLDEHENIQNYGICR